MAVTLLTQRILQVFVTHCAYPLTLLLCGVVCTYAIWQGLDLNAVHGWLLSGILVFYLIVEWLFPLHDEAGMTLGSLFSRDVWFLILNFAIQAAGRAAIGWLAITLSLESRGPLREAPTYVALPVLFLAFEALQYGYHRLCHELRGPIGAFLWKSHAAHHLPDRVYLLIHVVAHPFDLLAMTVALTVGLPYLLGCGPEVVFVFAVFANLQGIVAHINADVRAGWLNYLFSGPEVHRYHHSADAEEAKNFGAVLMIFDHIFGTFVYRPGQHPSVYGVWHPERYPASTQVVRVLALPFTREQQTNDSPDVRE